MHVTNWKDLRCIYIGQDASYGEPKLYLEDIVKASPVALKNHATIEDGRIVTFLDYYILSPEETPDWDTPRVLVDWTGFENALEVSYDEYLRQEIRHALGLDTKPADYLIEDESCGNELYIRLDYLQDGEIFCAFSLYRDRPQGGYYCDMHEYNGLAYSAKLPNGVITEAIVDLCLEIYKRRDELTDDFTVEEINGDHKGRWCIDEQWSDETKRREPHPYWVGHDYSGFHDKIRDLDCFEIYDMS